LRLEVRGNIEFGDRNAAFWDFPNSGFPKPPLHVNSNSYYIVKILDRKSGEELDEQPEHIYRWLPQLRSHQPDSGKSDRRGSQMRQMPHGAFARKRLLKCDVLNAVPKTGYRKASSNQGLNAANAARS
jgi:hypothetical protein